MEPEGCLGTEAGGLSVFEHGVALDGTVVGKTDEHLQLAAEAVGVDGLHGHALVGTIYHGTALQRIGSLHSHLIGIQHSLDAV